MRCYPIAVDVPSINSQYWYSHKHNEKVNVTLEEAKGVLQSKYLSTGATESRNSKHLNKQYRKVYLKKSSQQIGKRNIL